MRKKHHTITYHFCQERESQCVPVDIILCKGCDCFRYQPSSCASGLGILQSLLFLNKENDDIALHAVDKAHIDLRVSDFTAYIERNIYSRARHSVPTNITQTPEEFDGEIIDGIFALCRNHCEVKQIDELGMVVLLHGFCVKIVQYLWINYRLRQCLATRKSVTFQSHRLTVLSTCLQIKKLGGILLFEADVIRG